MVAGVVIPRTVLEAFVGPCSTGLECRHLDDNKRNNKPANLCWGTRKEQGEDRVRNGISKLSAEAREKVAAANRKRAKDPVWRAKVSAALKGRTFSAENRAKGSAAARKRGEGPAYRAEMTEINRRPA